MTKLTNRKAETLIVLRDQGPRHANPGLHISTLNALSLDGLVTADGIPSSFWPTNGLIWSITDAGRAALEEN